MDLPSDERSELQALTYLSDDTLWTIAREQMPPALQDCMSRLMDKNSKGSLSAEQKHVISRYCLQLFTREGSLPKLLRKTHEGVYVPVAQVLSSLPLEQAVLDERGDGHLHSRF